MYGNQNRTRLNSDAYRKRVQALVEEELGEAIENLEAAVSETIHGSIRDIVAASMGLSHRWGSWEVTRTNGIDGETPVGIAYREAATEKARELVTAAIKEFKPTKAMLTAIRKEYSDTLEYMCKEIAQGRAAEHAVEWGEKFVNAELEKLDLDKVEGVPPDEKAVNEFVARARARGVDEDAIAEILVLAGLTEES